MARIKQPGVGIHHIVALQVILPMIGEVYAFKANITVETEEPSKCTLEEVLLARNIDSHKLWLLT